MKYRVIREYGLYYPQMKRLFWWQAIDYPSIPYSEESDALIAIKQHNEMFGKDSKKNKVVWSGELE